MSGQYFSTWSVLPVFVERACLVFFLLEVHSHVLVDVLFWAEVHAPLDGVAEAVVDVDVLILQCNSTQSQLHLRLN